MENLGRHGIKRVVKNQIEGSRKYNLVLNIAKKEFLILVYSQSTRKVDEKVERRGACLT